jgi:hypothetical protein
MKRPCHVIIEGRERRMQSFNLPHEVYCKAMGVCSCQEMQVVSTIYSKADQQRHTVIKNKKINASLTVGYRKRVAVPEAALECPEIKSAIAQKRLRVRS